MISKVFSSHNNSTGSPRMCIKCCFSKGWRRLSQNFFAIPPPVLVLAAQFFCLLQWNHRSLETLFAWRFLWTKPEDFLCKNRKNLIKSLQIISNKDTGNLLVKTNKQSSYTCRRLFKKFSSYSYISRLSTRRPAKWQMLSKLHIQH